MRLELIDIQRISDTCMHNAFTDMCAWKGKFYCAYRVAPTHDIIPAGHVAIQESDDGTNFLYNYTLHHPMGDVRDPKFLVENDVLWCMCGVYIPSGGRHELSSNPEENIVQTHIAYTTDGDTWSPLAPIMRPNYWGWSAMKLSKAWVVASYHTGKYGEPASIVLWAGNSPLKLNPVGTSYNGGAIDTYGYSPSEPVVFYDYAADVVRLMVRTEGKMAMGAAIGEISNGESWRWRTSPERIHPSAVLKTPHGYILAGRYLRPRRTVKTQEIITPISYEATSKIWLIHEWKLRELITMPSWGDCAYNGLAMGEQGVILCSYYSQHETPAGTPGAAVYVARLQFDK